MIPLVRQLVVKDLRRAWRNPWPWLLNLALPLVITALFGLAFGGGGGSSGPGIGRIRLAVVDEDDTGLTQFLKGALNQGEASRHLEVSFPDRTNALRTIRENKLSAVFVIPRGFTGDFLQGRTPPPLELIKNPAQTIYPALVEEGLGVGVGFLNAASHTLGSLFPGLETAFRADGPPDFRVLGKLFETVGDRVETVRPYLDPPLVGYEKAVTRKAEAEDPGPGRSVFAFLLPGMASAFLLFLADLAMRDLFREQTGRTLQRYAAMRHALWPVVAGKVIFAMGMVWLGGLILLGGGAMLFGIRWADPLATGGLGLAYGMTAAGLLALLCCAARSERRSNALNNTVVMAIAFAGGSYFPASQLPGFVREHLSPWMPNYGFIETLRALQENPDAAWAATALRLAVTGVVAMLLASALLERRLRKGGVA